jgi:hypothetical protein
MEHRPESGRWGDGEMGRWGDGEMGRWGDKGDKGGVKFRMLLYSELLDSQTPKLLK